MSMYLTDRGTAYADGFYKVEGGRVINNFTGKSLGILIRTLPSTTYLFRKKPTLLRRFKKWYMGQQIDWDKIEKSRELTGKDLADTMKGLTEEKK